MSETVECPFIVLEVVIRPFLAVLIPTFPMYQVNHLFCLMFRAIFDFWFTLFRKSEATSYLTILELTEGFILWGFNVLFRVICNQSIN